MDMQQQLHTSGVPHGLLGHIGPQWFHFGDEMKVAQFDHTKHILVISGRRATLTIRPASSIVSGKQGWAVEWQFASVSMRPEASWGRAYFDKFDLAAAFGVSKSHGEFENSCIADLKPDAADPGKYCRKGRRLAIPCPGTGNNDDANVYVFVTDKIKKDVRELLS